MKLTWLIIAFLPAMCLAAPITNTPEPPSNLTAHLLTEIPPMKPVFDCIPVRQPTLQTQIQIRSYAKLPGVYFPLYPAAGLRKVSANQDRPTCTIKHYRMYSIEEQAQVVDACFNHKVHSAQAPTFANCTQLDQANTTQDALLPELIRMRKHYNEALAIFNVDRKADNDLVAFCLMALTSSNLEQLYRSVCDEFSYLLDPMHREPLKTNFTQREQYRLDSFQESFLTYCNSIGAEPDQPLTNRLFDSSHDEALFYCEEAHRRLAYICYYQLDNDTKMVTFCADVAKGPKDAQKEKSLEQLNMYYQILVDRYTTNQATVRQCLDWARQDPQRNCADKFRAYSDRRDPGNLMVKKVMAYYHCMVEKETAFYSAHNITALTVECV